MAPQPTLSVIIPAYNELDNFNSGTLQTVETYLKKQTYKYEVIVVDDGSTDGTADKVADWIKDKTDWRLIRNPHAGKSKTVETGMLAATGRVRLFTDFDQATPIHEVEKVLHESNQGADVVIGSRELEGASRNKEPFIRHLMGRVFNLLVQIIALHGITDSQCGFKAFSDEATKDLFSRMVVYKNRHVADAYTGAFDVELLFLARKLGYTTAQVPVTWHYVDSSRVNPAKDSIRMLWDIFKIRFHYLLGHYKKPS